MKFIRLNKGREWERWRMKEERERERDRSREFTSTPLARHSAPDCDIYSPSLTNPILLPPTRFDLAYSPPLSLLLPLVLGSFLFVKPHPRSILWHSNHPSYPFASPFPSSRNSTPATPSPCLSLRRHCAFASIPQCSVLGCCRCCSDGVAGCRWTTLAITPSTKNLYVWIYNKKSEKQKERERKRARNPTSANRPFFFLFFLMYYRGCKDWNFSRLLI